MEPTRQNNVINAIKKARKYFNETRSILMRLESILMRLESILMRLEVIFLVKEQRELEENSIKRKLSIIF